MNASPVNVGFAIANVATTHVITTNVNAAQQVKHLLIKAAAQHLLLIPAADNSSSELTCGKRSLSVGGFCPFF